MVLVVEVLVAPVLQLYDNAPLPVRVTELPEQIDGVLAVRVNDGIALFTVTVIAAMLLQLSALLPITV